MKRFTLLGFAVLAAVGALAGTALARGGDWAPVVANPFDFACSTATVHVSFPVNKGFQQVTTLPNGTLVIKATGSFKVHLATDAGASLDVNASGPSHATTFDPTTVDYDFIATGNNIIFLTPAQALSSGLPAMFTASGPIDLLFHSNGTLQVNKVSTKTITDVCAALGA